jgi:hypothetical protein
MPYDFNSAGEQRTNDLIADGTVATVHLTVRPGNAGEGGWLKRSKGGDSEALDCEFTVVDGPFAKRKFWTLFTVQGTTEGHQKAGEISAARLRAILESVHGIRPDDESAEAVAKRRVGSWGDFDGLRFVAKIGIEKAKEGSGFKDKNQLAEVITPDRKNWSKVEQIKIQPAAKAPNTQGTVSGLAQQAGVKTMKPAWAS